MSLYVGNLHSDCNEAILYKKFSLIGKVSSVKICRNSKTASSLGYGYVNFINTEDAKKAIETLNYDLLFDRAIRIMWANKNPTKFPEAANLVVKSFGLAKNELDIKDMFSSFGEILSIKVAKNIRGDSKGYAFVQFAEEQAARCAISELNGKQIDGNVLTVTRYIPAEERRRYQQTIFPNNIYVANLSTISSEELRKICEAFGDVVSTKVVCGGGNSSKGFAFVSFRERGSAEKAITELNRLCLNGEKIAAGFATKKQKNV